MYNFFKKTEFILNPNGAETEYHYMSSNEYGQRILSIMEKFKQGQANEQEVRELDQWYESFGDDEKYTTRLSAVEKSLYKERLLQRINKQLQRESVLLKKTKFRSVPSLLVSLVLILAVSFGLYTLIGRKGMPTGEYTGQVDIGPGGNKAVLTLADGRKISLTDAKHGELAKEANKSIAKTADGQVVYEIDGSSGVKSYATAYNSIETPKGGQYKVILPDGTVVWLNSASSLKYPVSFASLTERRVELKGEIYFEVAKDRGRPFIVTGGGQQVEVLGTHFNVNAYEDEPDVMTTLVEGRVLVSSGKDLSSDLQTDSRYLDPGQQALLSDGRYRVREVIASDVIAWKDGYFIFDKADIKTVMRQLARWYDMAIIYENVSTKDEFTGEIPRSSSLNEVLRILKLGGLNYTLKGRKLYITSED